MPQKQTIKKPSSKVKSSSQKKHQARAAKAMKKEGKTSTLKQAWKKV